MDQRIESFLADVLALAGEELDAIREGVTVALADCDRSISDPVARDEYTKLAVLPSSLAAGATSLAAALLRLMRTASISAPY